MAMNASAQSLIGLITNASLRFVVPVYQRPYSWDEEHCEQLWDDVLSVGKRPDDRHFTGSVVWVQDGVMSAKGITPRLLIDGQQRVTTVTLLLVALAEYAKENPDKALGFSYTRLINKGYLIDEEMEGDDRYKLTLSQGDRETLKSILEHLINHDHKLIYDSARIWENLNFFRNRLAALEDPNIVWDGIQRLDVVSISLDAGTDNPQLIFESMNSTGKDLSSADLIRNFVLMGLPPKQQDELYLNHWRVIEETLGADSYDTVFDSFIRNYLTVLYAPEPLAKRDVYPIFKRHVVENEYNKGDNMRELLSELEQFARYYSAITAGTEKDAALKEKFDSLARLDITVLNPLLMSFYQDYDDDAFGMADFLDMLELVESYVFRRAICDAPTNSLNKFLPSVIAKLNKVQEDEGNYREAFESLLLLEEGTARRFPSDTEFEQALATRDVYHFRKAFYMLTALENAQHPKDPHDFGTGSYTIEHIMPQNALNSSSWKEVLSQESEDIFETLLNNIGNLTLTAYNSELSDGSFEDKKKRCIGGFDKEYMAISEAVKNATEWNKTEIENRAAWLIERAVNRWPFLNVTKEQAQLYATEKGGIPKVPSKAQFRYVFSSGLIKPGDKLVPVSEKFTTVATVTEEGTIVLPNGEEFHSPSLAAIRTVSLAGGSGARNGWKFWRLGADGPAIDKLRAQYLSEYLGGDTEETKAFRIAFWDGFYDYCSTRTGFSEAFHDPSDRIENPESWAGFGIERGDCKLHALLWSWDKKVGADLHCYTVEAYQVLLNRKAEAEQMLKSLDGEICWDSLDADKKTRTLTIKRDVDFANDDLTEVYEWLANCMFALRNIAVEVLSV